MVTEAVYSITGRYDLNRGEIGMPARAMGGARRTTQAEIEAAI